MAEQLQPIIIKKIKKAAHGHHGGAWKLAYADFVTAMMAFFLLMWLLGSTDPLTRKGIAEFFHDPYKVSINGGAEAAERTALLEGGGTDMVTTDPGQVQTGETTDSQPSKPEEEVEEEVEVEAPEVEVEAKETSAPTPKKTIESVVKESFFSEIEALKKENETLKAELSALKNPVVEENTVTKLSEEPKPISFNPENVNPVEITKIASKRGRTIMDSVMSKINK